VSKRINKKQEYLYYLNLAIDFNISDIALFLKSSLSDSSFNSVSLGGAGGIVRVSDALLPTGAGKVE